MIGWSPEHDLGEKIWNDWNYATLPDGAVASWPDSSSAALTFALTAGANQPTKDSTGVVFTAGQLQNLSHAYDDNTQRYYRTVVVVFKCALAAAASSDGWLVTFNGHTGTADNLAPGLGYDRANGQYRVRFETTRSVVLSPGNDSDWHVVVMWRKNGVGYARIDGGTAVATSDTNVVFKRNNSHADSMIGDYRTAGVGWTLKRVLVMQGPESEQDEIERIEGWAKATYGCTLDPAHPFYTSAPQSVAPYVNPQRFTTPTQWAAISSFSEAHQGASIASAIAGLTEVFRDDFTADNIRDEITGTVGAANTPQWFAPVQGSIGTLVTTRTPSQSPSVYSQSGSAQRITMQNSAGVWYSGCFCSVDLDGRGNYWSPANGTTYFEASMKFSASNAAAAWPAFWIKDRNEFLQATAPRIEVDIVEAYNGSDPDGIHETDHYWPAARTYADRSATHVSRSDYQGLNTPPWSLASMFDENYHSYGVLITADTVIFTFDGYEVSRGATRPEMYRDLYILFDLSMYDATGASGTYWMDIDWVRVLQARRVKVTGKLRLP